MTPSWYDVLGVERTASPEEIRAAWRDAIADLNPGDARFRSANKAAEVLLDPESRAAYDAELPEEPVEDEEVPAAAPESAEPDQAEEQSAEPAAAVPPPTEDESTPTDATTASGPTAPAAQLWGAAVLGAVALTLVVLTIIAVTTREDRGPAASSSLPDADRIAQAQSAAETAVVPVLSYDYRTLDKDQAEAESYLTDDYAEDYRRYFDAAVRENAGPTRTIVDVQMIRSGIVRTGDERVDVLLFVNRPTSNRQGSITYNDQVTLQMVQQDGDWLVDCMIVAAGGTCGD